jgi:solute carrier family 25 S-adenosylmethionine transporter 26
MSNFNMKLQHHEALGSLRDSSTRPRRVDSDIDAGRDVLRFPRIRSLYQQDLISRSPTNEPPQAGAVAGTTVDTSLFPLDTIKTRLQSSAGFWAAGGFRGVYNGIGSAVVGSAPGAALFFVVYDGVKAATTPKPSVGATNSSNTGLRQTASHMLAASLGEIAACAVRVPTEVVKQRAQAKQHPSSLSALAHILSQRNGPGGWVQVGRELYRGWGITVLREVPFTVIQFPLWEALKAWSIRRRHATGGGLGKEGNISAMESAVYGSLSGAVAAAATTPLDLLKTRLMLSPTRVGVVTLAARIWRQEGARVFLSGIGPRVTWISIGGAVFLGSYQWTSNLLAGRS